MNELEHSYVGGDNSPSVRIEGGEDSWKFFDLLLSKAGMMCTLGAGFGKCVQDYIRQSAFNAQTNVDLHGVEPGQSKRQDGAKRSTHRVRRAPYQENSLNNAE